MDKNEELERTVYEKAERELSAYLAEMEKQDVKYVIEHAYEIVIMNDLGAIFEDKDFLDSELQELVKIEKPMAAIYEKWLKIDSSHMEMLRDTVEYFANDCLRRTAEKLHADPVVPRYERTLAEASNMDELHLYKASKKRDLECLHYFEKGVSDANEGHRMKAFTKQWAEEYGHDRCKFVLGYTVKRADWDGRYAPEAKRNAQQYDYQKDDCRNPFSDYGTNAHPCLVNAAYRSLMDMEKEKIKPQEPER